MEREGAEYSLRVSRFASSSPRARLHTIHLQPICEAEFAHRMSPDTRPRPQSTCSAVHRNAPSISFLSVVFSFLPALYHRLDQEVLGVSG